MAVFLNPKNKSDVPLFCRFAGSPRLHAFMSLFPKWPIWGIRFISIVPVKLHSTPTSSARSRVLPLFTLVCNVPVANLQRLLLGDCTKTGHGGRTIRRINFSIEWVCWSTSITRLSLLQNLYAKPTFLCWHWGRLTHPPGTSAVLVQYAAGMLCYRWCKNLTLNIGACVSLVNRIITLTWCLHVTVLHIVINAIDV